MLYINPKGITKMLDIIDCFRHKILIFFMYAVIIATNSFSQNENSIPSSNYSAFKALRDLIIEQTLKDNPNLKAISHKVNASKEAVNQIKLDPPQVGIEFFQSPISSFPNPLKDQMEIDYSIQQMIPFPGKLSSMSEIEQNRMKMYSSDHNSSKQEIIRQVKISFNDLYLTDRKIEINRLSQELIRNIIAIARKQYENGMGKQTDILRSQIEFSKLLEDSISLVQSRQSITAMINSYRNHNGDSIQFIPEIEPPELKIPSIDSLITLAQNSRPEFQSMEHNIAMQSSELAVAKKEFYPDFMIRGMYKQMIDKNDDWSLMIGLSVPVAPWSIGKYNASVKKAQASVDQSKAEFENMKNMVDVQIRDALANIIRYRDQVKLLQFTTIPQTQQTLQAAIAAYKIGDQDFLMLLDIQKMMLMAKQDYHMAVMNLISSYANLERAIGKSLEKTEISGGIYEAQ